MQLGWIDFSKEDQSYDAEKCPSGNSAAGAVPDDQLLLYVFGLHTADAGRVGGV